MREMPFFAVGIRNEYTGHGTDAGICVCAVLFWRHFFGCRSAGACLIAAEKRRERHGAPVPPMTKRPAVPEVRRSGSGEAGKEGTTARISKRGTYLFPFSCERAYIKPASAVKTAVEAPFPVAFADLRYGIRPFLKRPHEKRRQQNRSCRGRPGPPVFPAAIILRTKGKCHVFAMETATAESAWLSPTSETRP